MVLQEPKFSCQFVIEVCWFGILQTHLQLIVRPGLTQFIPVDIRSRLISIEIQSHPISCRATGYSDRRSHPFAKNLRFTIGYNYLDAQDAASIDAEISSDAYDRNPANIQHTNTPVLAPSLYGNKHRIVGSLYKRFNYNSWATHIALFAEYVQGGRFSYTYSGDINNDGSGLNDLLYIPTDGEIDQMQFAGDASAQRAALKAYIDQDDYLSENRGSYAEKYATLNPWYSRWDLRLIQEYVLANKNSIQLSIDILNVGNLLNSSWGVRQSATNTGLVQPIGVSVTDGIPTYSFDVSQKETFFNDFGLNSRWQAQVGLRYSF